MTPGALLGSIKGGLARGRDGFAGLYRNYRAAGQLKKEVLAAGGRPLTYAEWSLQHRVEQVRVNRHRTVAFPACRLNKRPFPRAYTCFSSLRRMERSYSIWWSGMP